MNFTKLTADTTELIENSNVQRDAYVDLLCSRKDGYTSKGQLFAIVCQAFEAQGIKPAPVGTTFEDSTQGQRDLRTVYSQACKRLGFNVGQA